MKLIAGLGNPGREYAYNRHNTGFHCINYLAKKHTITVRQIQCQSKIGKGNIGGVDVILAKPRTYVNNSGSSIDSLIKKYKIAVSDIIIIYDDLDLPTGKIRIRGDGTAGGHKGIKSIITSLGTDEFCRIKIGIGRPAIDRDEELEESQIIDYVLSDFTENEKKLINNAVARATEAIECIITDGITAAMNNFN
jgi:PTH1 family peptidyl-tRNA hydrolase